MAGTIDSMVRVTGAQPSVSGRPPMIPYPNPGATLDADVIPDPLVGAPG